MPGTPEALEPTVESLGMTLPWVHVGAGGGGGLLAVVQEGGLAVAEGGLSHAAGTAGADEHEAATADIAGGREDDGEGETDGYGCVDGIAAGTEDFDAGVGGVVVDADDHGVVGADGWDGGQWRGLGLRARLGRGRESRHRYSHCGDKATAQRVLH